MGSVTLTGAAETAAAFRAVDRNLERDFLAELGVAGEIVKDDAAERLWNIPGGGEGARNTAAKYRSRVRKGPSALRYYGASLVVVVDNPLKKVTGQHPDWGPTQLRVALEPALDDKRDEIEEALEAAVFALPTHYGF